MHTLFVLIYLFYTSISGLPHFCVLLLLLVWISSHSETSKSNIHQKIHVVRDLTLKKYPQRYPPPNAVSQNCRSESNKQQFIMLCFGQASSILFSDGGWLYFQSSNGTDCTHVATVLKGKQGKKTHCHSPKWIRPDQQRVHFDSKVEKWSLHKERHSNRCLALLAGSSYFSLRWRIAIMAIVIMLLMVHCERIGRRGDEKNIIWISTAIETVWTSCKRTLLQVLQDCPILSCKTNRWWVFL